ncbi:MAG: hypothetical protein HY951_02940 [Bacteroidia bacterium]|nr:hypothetical protein [Bacteroidia bacterium]
MRLIFLFFFIPLISSSQSFLLNKIEISGNNKTREKIILRELPFKSGDTIFVDKLPEQLKKAKDNLLNTSLFNFAEVDTFGLTNNTINISINVIERWYLWPIPIFEQASRNFNSWLDERDFKKVNYGLFLAQSNFRGRNELLRFVFRRGFREQYGFAYSVPGIDKKQKLGFEVKFLYYKQRKVAYSTIDNKPAYFATDNYNYQNSSSSISFTYRPGIYNWHSAEVSYNNHFITDTLFKINSSFLGSSIKNTQYFSLFYTFTRDKRNSNYYPLEGYYFSARLSKTGLNILKNEMNFFTINFKASKYFKLSKRFYFSTAGQAEYSSLKKYSYLFTRAFGYSNFTKGMELYVIDGNAFGLLHNSFRFQLIKPHIVHLRKIKAEKFTKFHFALYTSLNIDAGYVLNETEITMPHSNEFLYGYGIGVDFVTYYDIVFRFEFSANKFGQTGLFLHFNSPF